MSIRDFIYMALRRLRTRLFETIVIILAIGLGTGVISIALAITFTARDQTQAMQEGEHSRMINVRAGEDFMMMQDVVRVGEQIPAPAEITLGVMYGVRENSPAVDYVFYSGGTSLQLSEDIQHLPPPDFSDLEAFREWEEKRMESHLQVQTTTPDEFAFRNLELAGGSLFTDQDVRDANRVIVLGARAAEKLFPEIDPVGQRLQVVGQDHFTVIGVLEELIEEDDRPFSRAMRFNNGGFIPLTTAFHFRTGDVEDMMDLDINNFVAAVSSSDKLQEAENQVRSYLRARFNDGFNIMSPLTYQQQDLVRRAQIIAAFAASLGLLIAAINILNLMLAHVLKRTRELGVIKALGSTRRNILYLFLTEAFLLGLFGALLGLLMAFGGQIIIRGMLDGFPLSIDWRVFFSALAIAGFVSLLFGLYPASQAARIDPVEALRTE